MVQLLALILHYWRATPERMVILNKNRHLIYLCSLSLCKLIFHLKPEVAVNMNFSFIGLMFLLQLYFLWSSNILLSQTSFGFSCRDGVLRLQICRQVSCNLLSSVLCKILILKLHCYQNKMFSWWQWQSPCLLIK